MHQPDDPGLDDYDPTGYYERKTKHREEMLPLLGICFALGLVCVCIALAIQVFQ
jgi:hypothetical protein